jgi:hypothetical protein
MHILFGRPQHGGGAHLTIPPAGAAARARPSRLLVHLAGDFASEVAAVWPEPHTAFVLAEASRRHLVCLALSLNAERPVAAGPAFAAEALDGAFKRAVAALVPDAPRGLVRALGRLGEIAWSGADYRRLLELLGQPAPAKVLHHATAISRSEVETLASLPAMLTVAGGTILRLTPDQARLVALCHAGIATREGAERAGEIARRWAIVQNTAALLNQVREDLCVQHVEPFHPGSERLRPLATRAELADASRRYRNCLDGREPDPESHYYEWLGPPGVIVNIVKDSLWGWALDEGRLEGNDLPDGPVREAITAELRAMGVHVEPRRWNLNRMLTRAGSEGFVFPTPDALSAMAFEG